MQVQKFNTGELGGIGCLVDSCRDCKSCKRDEEQMCLKGSAPTYNGYEMDKKTPTYGGYSTHVSYRNFRENSSDENLQFCQIVTDENFIVKVSEKFKSLEGIAPLFCAGITTYSPLRANQSKVGPGTVRLSEKNRNFNSLFYQKVGVVGLGGLGHMGVKFAVSMGAEVTVFSTSPSKEADAKKLGAKHFVISKDEKAMKELAGTFDLILDTVSAKHDAVPYITALGAHGVLSVVGK